MAEVRGISPSFFAGMPTVSLDPNAGRMGEGYARMPGQALQDAENMQQHRLENDQQQAFRAREQGHRESQDRLSGQRDDQRLAMYQQGEDRRQGQQNFENNRLEAADTQRLFSALQAARKAGENGIAEVLAAELERRGFGARSIGPQGTPAPDQPAAQVAPVGLPAPPKPMSPGDQQLSGQLDGIEKEYVGGLRGGAPTAMPYDQASRESDQIGSLGIMQVPGGWAPIPPSDQGDPGTPPKPLLPGRALRAPVAQSNAMLSDGDPYANIK